MKAKIQADKQAYYQRNAEEFKAKARAYALARHEASPMIPCGCGCGEQIHSVGKAGKPVVYKLGHRHRLPVAHPVGEAHPNWKGDKSLPGTIHDWINRWYEKSGTCEECGAEGRTHFAFNHRLGEHTRNRGDYRELCPKCHNLWDIEMDVQVNVGTLRRKP